MSDRVPAQVIFYDIPDDREVPAILEWLTEWGMSPHYFGEPIGDRIELGTTYGCSDANVSIMLDGFRALLEVAPQATWKLTQDGYCEYDGEHATYVPELGVWAGMCTQDGEPTFTRRQILTAVEQGVPMDQLTGGPWVRKIEAFEREINALRAPVRPEGVAGGASS